MWKPYVANCALIWHRWKGRLAWRLSGAMLAIIVSLIGLMGVVIFQQF